MGAKLHWKYGSMNAGKSTVLMMIAFDYEKTHNRKVLVAKPKMDTKGGDYVVARLNNNEMKRKIDILISPNEDFFQEINNLTHKPDVILIDEAQFLSAENVKQLVSIVTKCSIPVIAFGLKSDFLGQPFEGSSWLFALAQDIEEIGVRSLCYCGSRATMNLRMINGNPVFEGKQFAIDGDAEVSYKTMCLKHFMKLQEEHTKSLM